MGVKKLFSNLVRSTAASAKEKKATLLKALAVSESELIKIIETNISNKLCPQEAIKSRYVVLEGSNNHGFLEHKCSNSSTSLITKLASRELIEREQAFLEWHSQSVPSESSFAPEYVASGSINESINIHFMTSQKCTALNRPKNDQVLDLYFRSQNGIEYFSAPASKHKALTGGSVIRDMLNNFVCNSEPDSALSYLKSYLVERAKKLSSHEQAFSVLQTKLLSFYPSIFNRDNCSAIGFVHGDFKASNMLISSQGKLLLIDFQYYSPGIKEWDLAFYLSKNKQPFNKKMPSFFNAFKEANEKQRLTFLYILATLLHPKPDKFEQLFRRNLHPAIQFLEQSLEKNQ